MSNWIKAATAAILNANKNDHIQIFKTDEEQRLFYAVVLEPYSDVHESGIGDSHGDVMNEAEIEKAAHYYMLEGQQVKDSHIWPVDVKVVESYINPVSYIPAGANYIIKKGAWVAVVKVFDESVWEDIKSGELNGFSPGGYGKRKEF